MFKITVSTTRSALFCLTAACLANAAHADVGSAGGIGGATGGISGAGVPTAVSDALLASTHAANLQRSIVTRIGGTGPAAIAPVHATAITTANNVRLWDEVIPPAPSPKPTQASLAPSQTSAASAPSRTTVSVSSAAPMPQAPQTSSTMVATNLSGNVGATLTRLAGHAR
ncbi:hypothetical protein [Pandoraea anhela]|uniref:Uncharacterized protein n=1 Tax=Pandoraea anhela TaxID=2508295 RepID=A0A5E4TN32_9BURK|nr:hypothetical protein [Pandoraea anhela]VVD89300.1 hypothetical protein PAN31108_01532 [Pandoraea anhela]